MREGDIARAFAGTGRHPVGAAERGEEVGVGLRARKLDRPRPLRRPGKRIGDGRRLGDRVGEDLGRETAGVVVGMEAAVVGVGGSGVGGELVGARVDKQPHDVAEIVTGADKLPCQGLEEWRVARGVCGAEIVDRLDEPNGEEMLPEAVDDRRREGGVVGGDHPLGEALTRVGAAGNLRGTPIEPLRRQLPARPRLRGRHRCDPGPLDLLAELRDLLLLGLDLGWIGRLRWISRLPPVTGRRQELRQFLLRPRLLPLEVALLTRSDKEERRPFGRRPAIEGHAGEEGSEVVVVVLGVFLERMVVAAGTADPHPEERLGGGVGRLRFDRLLLADRDDPPPHRRRGVAGREHVAHQVVPGPVGRHLTAQPSVERPHPLHPADIVIPLLPILEQIGELERPEVGELRSFHQPFHEQRPLVGGGVGKKGPHLLWIRERADEVEHQAPQERGVVAIIRRGDVQGPQLFHHVVVDKVAAGSKPLCCHLLRKRARDHDGVDEAGIGDDDRHLAMLLPAHTTLGRDRRVGGVVGMKTG